MSPTDYGWLVLLFPLLGTVLIMLGWPRWPGRSAGWVASAAIGLAFASSIGMLLTLNDQPEEGKSLIGTAYEYVGTSGFNADLSILVDPLSIVMCLVVTGRVVPDPPLLGVLHDLGHRVHALLRVPELLRVLDAAAGPGRQLRAADRGLGVRGRGLLPADQLLVPARHRHRPPASRRS